MREVEKSEGNYMSERPIGNRDRTEATNRPTKGQTDRRDFKRGKKQKKNVLFIIHEVFMLLLLSTTTTLIVESSFGSSQRVVTRGSILLLYIFLPRFSPFAFSSSSSSSPLGRVLSVSAVALGSV